MQSKILREVESFPHADLINRSYLNTEMNLTTDSYKDILI